ncbi:MAG: hypothetical protein ACJ8LG_23620 [Massilia sp.]
MNFSFLSLTLGPCRVKLWATGRYGFTLPKKVEITSGTGETSTFLYYNRKVGLKSELTNPALVRIAIFQFLGGDHAHPSLVELNDAMPPFTGPVTRIRSSSPPPAPPRVRPGRSRGRASSDKQPHACLPT